MIAVEQILLLRQLDFFNQVSDEALADLMSVAKEKTFKAREVIVEEGTKYAPLHVLLNGSVRVTDTQGQEQIQEAPCILCVHQVFNPEPIAEKIISHTRTVVLTVDKDALYRAFVLHPSLAFVFLQELSKKS